MRLAARILLFTAWVAGGPLSAGNPPFSLSGYTSRVWHTHDGLPEDTIQALAQTADGYLWIGTTGGLVRFDGVRFTVFTRENTAAFHENNISALLATPDGALWIGTQGGGLLGYRQGTFREYGDRQGIDNPYICAIFQNSRGELWVGTEWGLFRRQGEGFVRVDNRAGMHGMQVRAMAEDRQGRMWFAGTGLMAYTPGHPVLFRLPRPGAFFRSVLVAADGTVWAGSVTGLERMDPGAAAFRKVDPRQRVVETLAQDRAGNLWIGTLGDGLIRYRDGKAQPLTAPDTLPDNQVYAVLEDSESNLWFGTGNGLLRVSPEGVSRVTTGARPPDDNLRTVYRDAAGTLWIVAASGRVYRLRDGKLLPADLPDGVRGLDILNVFRERNGALWFGTGGMGAVRWDRTAVERYSSRHGLTNDFIRAFCQAADGAVWIGTNGGLTRVHGGTMERFHPLRTEFGPGFRGLPYASVRALLADENGDVWIGTDGGLARFHDGAFADDEAVRKLRGVPVWTLYQDARSDVWLGSRGDGLFLVHGGAVRQFTTRNGLPSNSIYAILGDPRGLLWLSGPSGVFATTRADLDRSAGAPLAGTFADIEAGQIAGGIQPAGAMSGDSLWFPSTAGVVRMTSLRPLPKPLPPVIVEEAIADGRQAPTTGELRLGPGHGELEIHYTEARLNAPEAIRFRYKLEGFDADWVDARRSRVAHYTNLAPGSYRFRVQAYDASAPTDPSERILPLIWRPHFYQSTWFYAACAACALLTIWLMHQARIRRERLRFRAVLEERSRLAREMHDTLVQGCVGAFTLLQAAGSLEAQSPEKARDLLGRAREQVRCTIDEARRAIWNLRHSHAGESLGVRLSEMAASMGGDAGIPIRIRLKGTAARLESDAEENLLLVVREAIRNAIRHASAASIQLEVQYRRRSVKIRISDDGRGFVPAAIQAQQGPHYGLLGMRERVQRLGGRLQLSSGPGKGTVVGLSVPLKRAYGEPS
jgi:ligand-binding sensor domain-containing protein/signal transduction histidine kinase